MTIAQLEEMGPFVVLDSKKWGGRSHFYVRCFCGHEKWVTKADAIRSKSCGCLTKQLISNALRIHGETDTPTWKSWKSMLDRCYLKKHKSWPKYGGAGIVVCGRWHSYVNFRSDMGKRPDGMTIGRLDHSDDYKPRNCSWQTYKQQAAERRSTVWLTFRGQTHHASEWGRITGISRDTLSRRLELGWSVERALTQPIRKQKNSRNNMRAECVTI
jgi:ribulose bisphosphate carboxylase small subunit